MFKKGAYWFLFLFFVGFARHVLSDLEGAEILVGPVLLGSAVFRLLTSTAHSPASIEQRFHRAVVPNNFLLIFLFALFSFCK
jgi:hypothetical protein